MKKVKLGIIGIGNMGSSHMKNILAGKCPEIDVAAVADIDPTRLEAAKGFYDEAKAKNPDLPEVAYFDDAIKMMESGLIDSVIVAIPHYDHPKYVIEAFRHGIHAISEKPAGVYTLQVREMMEEAETSQAEDTSEAETKVRTKGVYILKGEPVTFKKIDVI